MIERTIETVLTSIPIRNMTAWDKKKEKYTEILDQAEQLYGTIAESYHKLEHHRDLVTEKHETIIDEIKRLKRQGREEIRKYASLQHLISEKEEEMMIYDDNEERDMKEDERDAYITERDALANDIVKITTRIQYRKERKARLTPVLESIKQRTNAARNDYEHAENIFEEMRGDVHRYSDKIRSGLFSRIRSLERTMKSLAKRYDVIYLSSVDFRDLRENEVPTLDGKRAQLINDDYVGKCIEYLEGVNADYTA